MQLGCHSEAPLASRGADRSLHAATVVGGKEKCFCISILLSSRHSLGAPAPLIQSTSSL